MNMNGRAIALPGSPAAAGAAEPPSAAAPMVARGPPRPAAPRFSAVAPAELAVALRALPDEAALLVVDVRAADVFARGHVASAVNVCLPSTLLRRTSFGLDKLLLTLTSDADRRAFAGLAGKTLVVLVDGASDRLLPDSPGALLLQKLAKDAGKAKLGFLQGGFAAFAKEFPDLVSTSEEPPDGAACNRPSHLPSVAGAGAISVVRGPASAAGTPGPGTPSRIKPILTAPAGFFPPHAGGASSEYQTHVDSAPEELRRMRIFGGDVAADGLPGFLRELVASGDVGARLREIFKVIESEEQQRFQSSWRATSPGDPFSISVGIEKGYKNRYSNIWPYNANRFVLKGWGQVGCDYINASYIDLPKQPHAYICTQGPIPSTFADFWLMVYESNSRIVLMLTKEEDHGRRQCHRYWPSAAESVMDLGPQLSVHIASEEQIAPHLVARKLVLTCRGDPPEVEKRHVLQLQYLAWPDHGVPEDARKVIEFRELVDVLRARANGEVGESVPMVVHCSAGCGRTGTFCTIDHVFDELFPESRRQPLPPSADTATPWYDALDLGELVRSTAEAVSAACGPCRRDPGTDLVFDTVMHLRTQRLLMVQTYAQLAFCYEALLNKCISQRE
ncbi:protein-tyrosine phosphatase-like protein [Hyaloraphidium curvatum]|nr:protein-tyrosine phosphatase-like protein [Hyaloraphidium curvatum]